MSENSVGDPPVCKCISSWYFWGRLGGAMVLGKLSVPGRPTYLD